MENSSKSLIVAKRIRLKFVSELVGCILLLCICVGLAIFMLHLGLSEIYYICIGCCLIVCICGFFEMNNIYKNNKSNDIMITYKNDTFTIVDGDYSIQLKKENITDLDFKNKKAYISTPHYWSVSEYNYGKFYIYYVDGNYTYKLKLKNIAEPDKVLDKMVDLLEWNIIEN